MDSYNFCNIRVEKANAIKKHRQIQKITNLFRVVEICLVLALVSWFSIPLPVAVKNSGGYFKGLTVFLVSPQFVFVIGNVIVITLFAKSGRFSGQDSKGNSSRFDLYEEFVEKSQGMHRCESGHTAKQSSCVKHLVTESTNSSMEIKNYRRSQSQTFQRPKSSKPCKELRRAVTETLRTSDSREGLVEKPYAEDNMSNEEFRCAVETFIARQKQLRIDEEKYVI
ncbi:hypothetical protein K2173_002423 [Erythroxylum novogranatense]|uniref:DUF4408 domain-containing protein n=1 Tax=Erythroxylum novogranatense TaxID=1862640 RepID=A0AAV8TA10_9ROSI|nr:hypothetical protein K2173_002423 [Erythroxylum novogranatense]